MRDGSLGKQYQRKEESGEEEHGPVGGQAAVCFV